MDHWLIGGGLAAAVGALLSWGSYLLSRMLLDKKPELLSMVSMPRQIVNIAYLAVIYFLADKTPWGLMPLLIGAAVGLTGAMFLFTRKLLKVMDGETLEEKEREGDDNG